MSTADQATEGVSLDAQEGRIREWCRSRSVELDPADLFIDAGMSGKRADNRPGLQAALDAACASRGVVVVYSLSRLARSTRDTLAITDRLERAGADLVSLSEKLDTTSASGKMVFRLLAVLAEFERDLISERTKTALNHKRGKCERIGKVPYGRRLDADGRTLLEDAGELATLEIIRSHASEGLSPRWIARYLNALGLPTKSGRPWAHSTIVRILKREPSHRATAAQEPVNAP